MPKTILITGATGLIGRSIVKALVNRGDKIIALSTNVQSAKQKLPSVGKILSFDEIQSLKDEKIDAIINLAGASIGGKRWSENYKKVIYDSRIKTTRKITDLVSVMDKKPEVLLNMSGIDYYGDTGDKISLEDAPNGNTFLAGVCKDWETEALKAASHGVRVVILRTAFVMAKNSEGIRRFIQPFSFFIGGPLGSGKQYMSWVHLDDVTGIFLFALDNAFINGTVNVCSSNPEIMKNFCSDLGKAMKRPSLLPVPSFMIKLIAGEMSEVILTGRRAIPEKILKAGYKFKFDSAFNAWKDVLKK